LLDCIEKHKRASKKITKLHHELRQLQDKGDSGNADYKHKIERAEAKYNIAQAEGRVADFERAVARTAQLVWLFRGAALNKCIPTTQHQLTIIEQLIDVQQRADATVSAHDYDLDELKAQRDEAKAALEEWKAELDECCAKRDEYKAQLVEDLAELDNVKANLEAVVRANPIYDCFSVKY
jgi:DNA repair exonuclease SbcCD ATPase subunit